MSANEISKKAEALAQWYEKLSDDFVPTESELLQLQSVVHSFIGSKETHAAVIAVFDAYAQSLSDYKEKTKPVPAPVVGRALTGAEKVQLKAYRRYAPSSDFSKAEFARLKALEAAAAKK